MGGGWQVAVVAVAARLNRSLIGVSATDSCMLAAAESVLETVGPFVIPVVIFTLGALGYLVLYVYYRWRDGDL
jgi:hypothetical protein